MLEAGAAGEGDGGLQLCCFTRAERWIYILRPPGRYAFRKGYRALPKTPKTCLPDQAMPHALSSETRCLSAIYARVQHGVLAYLRKQGPQA